MFKDYYTRFPKVMTDVVLGSRFATNKGFLEDCVMIDVEDFKSFRTREFIRMAGNRNFEREDNEFYYPVAVYYTSLVPQIFRAMGGYELMVDFHRCSSWPLISCGFGGVMDPIHTLWEAGLMPGKLCNVELLISTIKEASDVIEKDMTEFLAGGQDNTNSDAYRRLLDAMDGKTEEFLSRFHYAVEYFLNWIVEPVLNTDPKSLNWAGNS